MKRKLVKQLTKCVGMSLAMAITLAGKGKIAYAATQRIMIQKVIIPIMKYK